MVNDFPVLSAGPTPSVPFDQWLFAVEGAVDQSRYWTWNEFTALPSETDTSTVSSSGLPCAAPAAAISPFCSASWETTGTCSSRVINVR